MLQSYVDCPLLRHTCPQDSQPKGTAEMTTRREQCPRRAVQSNSLLPGYRICTSSGVPCDDDPGVTCVVCGARQWSM
jgi:hypothetical protein